jgi:hypothetical protein
MTMPLVSVVALPPTTPPSIGWPVMAGSPAWLSFRTRTVKVPNVALFSGAGSVWLFASSPSSDVFALLSGPRRTWFQFMFVTRLS